MKIYDISQEVFSCTVYPGDTAPYKKEVRRMERGDLYNLTDFFMCAHNGTHVDAPFHFLADGKRVDEIALSKTVGICYVAHVEGVLEAADAERIIKVAQEANRESVDRLLLRGEITVTPAAAEVFAAYPLHLIGVESQSVGEEKSPMEVHRILLSREVVLLEGIRLSHVPEGVYFLSAAPLALGGCDGAPCRAILIER